MDQLSDVKRVAIIGAGPAGIATVIQLHRYRIEPAIFEAGDIGGMLLNANLIENYPGFLQGIRGTSMVKLLRRQLHACRCRVKREEVTNVQWQGKQFEITTNKGSYTFSVVIVASGTKPRIPPDMPTPEQDPRIFTEVTKLWKKRLGRVLIVGAGDLGFDYSLSLAEYHQVVLINRQAASSAVPVLQARARRVPNITYLTCTSIDSLSLESEKIVVMLRNGEGDYLNKETFDYLVWATGREPNLDFLHHSVTENRETLEAEHKLYIIGDAAQGHFRQLAVAVGQGIDAAMSISCTN